MLVKILMEMGAGLTGRPWIFNVYLRLSDSNIDWGLSSPP